MQQNFTLQKMYKYIITLSCLAVLVGCLAANSDDMNGSAGNIDLLKGTHIVTIETTVGDIILQLDADKAPLAVTNFVSLAKKGFYNDLKFHRVIPDFMIQGGDPLGNGTGGESIYGYEFKDEQNDIPMDRGVIAMANRGPNTNQSQFFIIQSPNGTPWLKGKHTAFGKVIAGMNVVDAIATTAADALDMPLEPITYTVTVNK